MKRNAGSHIHGRRIKAVMFDRGGEGVLWGIAIGLLLYAVFSPLIGYGWGFVPYLVTLVAVYIAVEVASARGFSRWNYENLEKGENAETRVGQLIEYALTRDGCAVAHSVTAEIAKVGDIDHIVATPSAIWVIETKYKKVPPKRFPEVLSRIAANTESVRQWAPVGTSVRACLVLAYENKIGKQDYSYRGERIKAYTPNLLVSEIQGESQCKRTLDENVMDEIWKLGLRNE